MTAPEQIKSSRSKSYRERHPEKMKECTKRWREKNWDRYSKNLQRYLKNKRDTDIWFRVIDNLRKRTRKYIKLQGFASYKEKINFKELLGVSDWNEVITHLKEKFEGRYGHVVTNEQNVHCDHITPLATAKTYEELKTLLRKENVQILMVEDHKEKTKGDGVNVRIRDEKGRFVRSSVCSV